MLYSVKEFFHCVILGEGITTNDVYKNNFRDKNIFNSRKKKINKHAAVFLILNRTKTHSKIDRSEIIRDIDRIYRIIRYIDRRISIGIFNMLDKAF